MIKATNNGAAEVSNLGIRPNLSRLPADLTLKRFESEAGTGISMVTDLFASSWDIPSLPAGEMRTFTIEVEATFATRPGFTITVDPAIWRADQVDPNTANNTASAQVPVTGTTSPPLPTIVDEIDLVVSNLASKNATAAPGAPDTLIYTVTVTNQSPNVTFGGPAVNWPVGILAPGAMKTMTLTYRVGSSAKVGTVISNAAALKTNEPNEGQASSKAETAIVDAPACSFVPSGDRLFFDGFEIGDASCWNDLQLVRRQSAGGLR